MKIWGDIPGIQGIYKSKLKNVVKAEKKESAAVQKDKLSISNEARDFQTVMKALAGAPSIREEKVSEISKQIEKGNYNPSSKDIVEKMFQTMKKK